MKILVFSWRDPKHPLAGGAEQVMHEHMKGWITNGHKVTLFSSRFAGSEAQEVLDGVQIVRSGYQYLGVQLAGFFYYLKNQTAYDFVVDQFHGFPFFTPLYVRKPKLAVIQETAREVWFLNPLPLPFNWLVGVIGYLTEPFIFLLYHWTYFMTGSRSAKEDVARFGTPKENITIVPHGVLINKHKNIKTEKQKKKTVIYLGVLSKDKGIEDALKCFSILKRKDKWQFWVVGKADTKRYMEKLVDLCHSLNLGETVKFWGFVSQEKKFELLARAHVLVNPSVREGWGLVNIEANSMGTPVVAYRSPGLVDSVKEGISGIFCKENLSESMATAVRELLSDAQKYTKLSYASIEWSKRFSWESSRKQSLQLIEKIVRRNEG